MADFVTPKCKKILLTCVCFLFLTGCGARRTDYGTIKLAIPENPTTLDPALIVDVLGGGISAKIFNGLVRADKDLHVVGDIASSWDISSDGKRYTFTLRDDVFFHNGRRLTPLDVKYSFERVLNPETGSARKWIFNNIVGVDAFTKGEKDSVTGIKVVNKNTLQIELSDSFGPFLWLLTMPNAYIVPKEEVHRLGEEFSRRPIGTGPFMLKEWKQDYEIVLEAHTRYFDNKPKMKGIEYRIIPDEFSSLAEFENGNLDIVSIPRAEYKTILNDQSKKENIFSCAGLNTYYLGFNCSRHPFNNKIVRQAVNYAIDREKIARNLLDDRVNCARSVLPPQLDGGEYPQCGYPYDPQKARDLLREAGISGELTITLYQNRTKEAAHITEVVQHYLKAVGINAVIIEREWSSFKETVINGEPDMFLLSWWADYPDAENFFFPNFHSLNHGAGGNKTRFDDARIDALIREAQKTIDAEKRKELYVQLNKEIFEEAPWVFLWHKGEYVLTQPWVKGYTLYPIYNSDKGTDIWIDVKKISAKKSYIK